MKTIIAGSRTITDMADVNDAVAASMFLITEVVCGMARGADLLGKEWAQFLNIPVKEFPADWNKHGKRAGYLRNEQMAEYADVAIVIWDGNSPGSKHMIDIARRHRLKTYVHIPGVLSSIQTRTVNLHSPTANMYGCEPCPRCKSQYRVSFADSPNHITCDDCFYMELIHREGNLIETGS
jgi:hypothetical protein